MGGESTLNYQHSQSSLRANRDKVLFKNPNTSDMLLSQHHSNIS